MFASEQTRCKDGGEYFAKNPFDDLAPLIHMMNERNKEKDKQHLNQPIVVE